MKLFEILIKIDFLKKDINFKEFKKDYIYHAIGEKIYIDKIKFNCNEIKISGKRTAAIDPKNMLYTKKSRVYRECVSSLLFLYFKYGNFKILQISLNNHTVPEYFQKFETELPFDFYDIDIDLLFDYRDDKIYIPLMHIVEASYYPQYALEHSWKAFNYIYNTKTGNNKDKEGIQEVIKIIRANEKDFESILKIAKKNFYNITIANVIKYVCKNDNTLYKHPIKFLNSLEISSFNDKELLQFIKERFNNIYKKYKADYEKNKATGSYMHIKTKDYVSGIKNLDRIIKKGTEKEYSDYILFLILYIQYLRNKSMHGVFPSPSFIFTTEYTEELNAWSEFVCRLCIELLKNNIYELS